MPRDLSKPLSISKFDTVHVTGEDTSKTKSKTRNNKEKVKTTVKSTTTSTYGDGSTTEHKSKEKTKSKTGKGTKSKHKDVFTERDAQGKLITLSVTKKKTGKKPKERIYKRDK
tara:strand:- start:219 stop:557 length:339 start_codon:yes stop_codon:yes gene_type:complete